MLPLTIQFNGWGQERGDPLIWEQDDLQKTNLGTENL